jgi:hypothetical protein
MSEEKELVHCPSCIAQEMNLVCHGECLCHNPLGVNVGEEVKSQDRFGR